MRRAQLPYLSFPILSPWKERCQKKTLQTRSRSIVPPVQALNDFIFQGLHRSETRLMRIPRTSLSITLVGLRFTESLLATVFAKKNLLECLFQGSQLLSWAFCVFGPFPAPLTDAWILVSSSLAFSFRLPFCEALPPLWLLLFLTPFPQLLNYTAPTGTYTIKNSSPPAASRSASPGAERLAPGTGRALGSWGRGRYPDPA